MPLTLSLRPDIGPIPIESDQLRPDALATLSEAAVAKLPVKQGARRRPLAEFFTVAGSAADGVLRIEGNAATVTGVGRGMASGHLTVEGNVGRHAGAEMTGGILDIAGDAGDWLGAEMAGGLIRVAGSAGAAVGSVYRGGKIGMRAGAILVTGSAGAELGAHMRRGLIAVGGAVGAFAGVSVIAGSIFLFGPVGPRLGASMKRGTLALFDSTFEPANLLPTFGYACEYAPSFLWLYLTKLRDWGFAPARAITTPGLWRRYVGDRLESGKGEILVRARGE